MRGMTPGLWAIDLDHLVVIMMTQLLTDRRHWPWPWAIDLDDLVVVILIPETWAIDLDLDHLVEIMMTELLTWIIRL